MCEWVSHFHVKLTLDSRATVYSCRYFSHSSISILRILGYTSTMQHHTPENDTHSSRHHNTLRVHVSISQIIFPHHASPKFDVIHKYYVNLHPLYHSSFFPSLILLPLWDDCKMASQMKQIEEFSM